MLREVPLHLLDYGGIVRTRRIQPEDSFSASCASTGYSELHPILDRNVFGLTHAPNIPLFYRVLHENTSSGTMNYAHDARLLYFESPVMGPVLLRFLGHQPDVGDAAHRGDVEGAVLFAISDDLLEHASVAAVGNHRFRVLHRAVNAVHLARRADHRRHRRVDNDVARHVQVCDPLVGIHHGKLRTPLVRGLDVSLDCLALLLGQCGDLREHIPEAIIGVDTKTLEERGVLLEDVLEVDADNVTKHDGVGNLHHRRF
mmetsp:Transcript_80705/g.224624  ORF Transcript_80705/g.224624 Transcript_80705/m.224624 type:complete len:257 (+) Transcript_80705:632-1402(+)